MSKREEVDGKLDKLGKGLDYLRTMFEGLAKTSEAAKLDVEDIWDIVEGATLSDEDNPVIEPPTPEPEPEPEPDPIEPSFSVSALDISLDLSEEAEIDYYIDGSPRVRIASDTVDVTMIRPGPANGATNGAELNLKGGARSQGFSPDCDGCGYDASLNIHPAHTNKSIKVKAGDRLACSITNPGNTRPQLKQGAVITFVDLLEPKVDSYRPAYCGPYKVYPLSQVDWNKLPAPKPVMNGGPTFDTLMAKFDKPWLYDHVYNWGTRDIHATDNMPVGSSGYGRDMTHWLGLCFLFILQDHPLEQRKAIAHKLIQIGIDAWGIVLDGGGWVANGGHQSGRKSLILFAKHMLGESWDTSKVVCGEDQQTYWVGSTPKWEERPGRGPNAYQWCCTANVWRPQLLAMKLMGLQAEWNHDVLFDYMDWYHDTQSGRATHEYQWNPYRPYVLDCWENWS